MNFIYISGTSSLIAKFWIILNTVKISFFILSTRLINLKGKSWRDCCDKKGELKYKKVHVFALSSLKRSSYPISIAFNNFLSFSPLTIIKFGGLKSEWNILNFSRLKTSYIQNLKIYFKFLVIIFFLIDLSLLSYSKNYSKEQRPD